MQIKWMHKSVKPHIRRRDNQEVTHQFTVMVTSNEALAISELFKTCPEDAPSLSVIRSLLVDQALSAIDNNKLTEIMARFEVIEKLAGELAGKTFSRVLTFLHEEGQKKKLKKENHNKHLEKQSPRRVETTVIQSSGTNTILRRRIT